MQKHKFNAIYIGKDAQISRNATTTYDVDKDVFDSKPFQAIKLVYRPSKPKLVAESEVPSKADVIFATFNTAWLSGGPLTIYMY